MFKENKAHLQNSLFSFLDQLSNKKRALLMKSKESYFYNMIFCNINEKDFAVLYSETGSRPNAPINAMVSALILKELYCWSFEELFANMDFDLRARLALGLTDMDKSSFCRASLFNFQNRLLKYHLKTGINLLENIFNNFTAEQLKKLKLKTCIQRTDSTSASSNIRRYGRLQLLIEVLLRLNRVLSDSDRRLFLDKLSIYTNQKSEQYIYKLRSSDLPHETQKVGELYHKLYAGLKKKYSDNNVFQIFERVYKENFIIVSDKVEVISSKEIGSSVLQSPDDLDATYRKKNNKESRGQVLNVVETANPENELQLITDVSVAANNIDDSDILENRLDVIKEKTPDLTELHTDGGYGSKDNDKKMNGHNIIQIQTAVRGRKSDVEITIEKNGITSQCYDISCPKQTVQSIETRQRHKAVFNTKKCVKCQIANRCNIYNKHNGIYYFTDDDYQKNKRQRNILNIPAQRRKLRPNVEATMKEFKWRMPNGKLKVRGYFKTALFAFTAAIAINFGRIYRYVAGNQDIFGDFFNIFVKLTEIFMQLLSRKLLGKKYRKLCAEFGGIPV